MTAYTVLHLVLAGAFFALALLHTATWVAVRTQRVQLWLGTGFLGFAVLALTTGLTSDKATVMLADTRPWLLARVLLSIPLPYTLLRVVWALLDVPLTRWRRVGAGVALVLGAVRVLDVAASLFPLRGSGLTAEALSQATRGLSLPLFWLVTVCVGATWAVEGLRLLTRRGAMAAAVLVCALLAFAVLGRELAVDLGWVAGSSLLVLVGLPFLLLASTALAILTARSLRGADLGTGIHRYRRLVPLGRGGMGEVWLAVRTGRAGFHRLVVLKQMLEQDGDEQETLVRRFIGEARTAARLHHPNLVSVHDLGQIDGAWFIVMEYLSGVNVLELVRRVGEGDALPLEVIVDICQQSLRGLTYAHEHGVLHRDISADNLFASFDGVVKVVDFGIAHRAGEARALSPTRPSSSADGERLTQGGFLVGKTAYMPPERLQGAEATESGDLFALGCVLYELLFGDLPHLTPSGVEVPLLERAEAPAAAQLLGRVLSTALDAEPARRFQDVTAFSRSLEEVRRQLPAVELASWLREHFVDRWTRERQLLELDEPTASQVEALLRHVGDPEAGEPTHLLEAAAAQPIAEQRTQLRPRLPGAPRR